MGFQRSPDTLPDAAIKGLRLSKMRRLHLAATSLAPESPNSRWCGAVRPHPHVGEGRLVFNVSRDSNYTHTHTHTQHPPTHTHNPLHTHTQPPPPPHTHNPRGPDATEMCMGFRKSPPHEGLAQALRMESRCSCCRHVWRSPEGPVFLLLRAAHGGPSWERSPAEAGRPEGLEVRGHLGLGGAVRGCPLPGHSQAGPPGQDGSEEGAGGPPREAPPGLGR